MKTMTAVWWVAKGALLALVVGCGGISASEGGWDPDVQPGEAPEFPSGPPGEGGAQGASDGSNAADPKEQPGEVPEQPIDLAGNSDECEFCDWQCAGSVARIAIPADSCLTVTGAFKTLGVFRLDCEDENFCYGNKRQVYRHYTSHGVDFYVYPDCGGNWSATLTSGRCG